MSNSKIVYEGFTYDDVLLLPRYSEILPRETELKSMLTSQISLNIPLISAAMDTVTEANMGRAIAREGGIGVVHKNMSIEKQAEQIDIVKRSESGMIKDPITLSKDNTIAEALNIMSKFRISGIPIIDESRKLIGILTNRDLRFKPNPGDLIKDSMTHERIITTPQGTTLEQAELLLQEHRIEKLPVVDDNFILRGLITFKDIQKKKKYPNACKDEQGRLRIAAGVGVTGDTIERVDHLVAAGVDVIFVDTAHGHSLNVINMVKSIKSKYPDLPIIGGNIATGDAAKALAKAGAEGVKVGIGPGSICTTRIIAGVGVPQLSAVMDVSKIAEKYGVTVIADGGIKQTGDIAKAIAAGADTIMIGSLFAGHEESPGDKIIYEGRAYKAYRGMGSLGAMTQGSADRYFQDIGEEISKFVPEGIEGRVPYKGRVHETIYQLIGGLRSAMGYCGCKNIQEMKNDAQFIKITVASLKESHPHNIAITKESPNYFVQ